MSVRELMAKYRLTVGEVAQAAGVSPTSVIRLRRGDGRRRPRSSTIVRVAEGIADLAHLDPDDVQSDLMASVDPGAHQFDLGLRGIAELTSHYRAMSSPGRRILLEQARLLAETLPAESELGEELPQGDVL